MQDAIASLLFQDTPELMFKVKIDEEDMFLCDAMTENDRPVSIRDVIRHGESRVLEEDVNTMGPGVRQHA